MYIRLASIVMIGLLGMPFAGCSDKKKEEAAKVSAPSTEGGQAGPVSGEKAKPGPGRKAAELGLDIRPTSATKATVLSLSPQGFDYTGPSQDLNVYWTQNGTPISTEEALKADLKNLQVRKGDTMQGVAKIGDKAVMSAPVVIQNAPPELKHVKIMPEAFGPGDRVYIEAKAEDLDGDPVEIQYAWTLNGQPAGNTAVLSTEIKGGDVFMVAVTPGDGESQGQAAVLQRTIRNFPPMLTKHDNYTFANDVYTYEAKATDPDGDRLTYKLQKAPEGMSMDSSTGRVAWHVPQDFVGTAEYVIEVSDGNGGSGTMLMRFTITEE